MARICRYFILKNWCKNFSKAADVNPDPDSFTSRNAYNSRSKRDMDLRIGLKVMRMDPEPDFQNRIQEFLCGPQIRTVRFPSSGSNRASNNLHVWMVQFNASGGHKIPLPEFSWIMVFRVNLSPPNSPFLVVPWTCTVWMVMPIHPGPCVCGQHQNAFWMPVVDKCRQMRSVRFVRFIWDKKLKKRHSDLPCRHFYERLTIRFTQKLSRQIHSADI